MNTKVALSTHAYHDELKVAIIHQVVEDTLLKNKIALMCTSKLEMLPATIAS